VGNLSGTTLWYKDRIENSPVLKGGSKAFTSKIPCLSERDLSRSDLRNHCCKSEINVSIPALVV